MAQARNPSDWSRAVTRGFRNNLRGVCRVAYSAGYAAGGFLTALRLTAGDTQRAQLDRALRHNLLPALLQLPRITGVHYAVCDPVLSNAKANAQGTRKLLLPDHVVIIEGSTAAGVRAAADAGLSDAMLRDAGAAANIVRGHYQLEYLVSSTNMVVGA
jgi:hypothetical protein